MPCRLSRSSYWRLRLASWPAPISEPAPGYTLLVPVPGDIPVFLDLALRVCRSQAAEHRVRTLVITDRPAASIERTVEDAKPSWTGPLDLVLLPRPERWILPHMKSGSRNHGMQLVAGVSASRSTHVVLHDADLFLLDDQLLDSQYRESCDRDLDCLGVSPAPHSWIQQKGLRLAATWELVAAVEWIRRYPPHQHLGHDAELSGERHTFDTTLYPQALNDPSRVDWTDRSADFVHFNYVITTYRHFQRHGPGFLDENFRLLLVALFVDLFSDQPPPAGLPRLEELAAHLGRPGSPVQYRRDGRSRTRWAEFRRRLDRMLAAPYLEPAEVRRATGLLALFDDYHSVRPA